MRVPSLLRTVPLLLVATVCADAQVPTADPSPDGSMDETAPAAEPSAVEPWDETFAFGVGEVVRLAASDDPAGALEVCDRLLSQGTYGRWRTSLEEWSGGWTERLAGALDRPLVWLGFEARTERDRAEVRYLRGLLQNRLGAVLSADLDFELARMLAGEGTTRRDAIYALGTLDLEQGEFYRQKIPEISGVPPAPLAGPPAGGEQPPDPLQVARAFYMEAREHLVERLRMDWQDSDTRANVQLVQRRLAELDRIEGDRAQAEQDPSQDPNQDPQEIPDEAGQDPDQEREPEEGEQEPEEQDPSQEQQDSSEDSQQAEQEAEPEERALTEEEMKRLLQLLREYHEQGQELERNLRAFRRERVKKDW